MQPTPLCGPKIAAILKVGLARLPSRSTSAARLMGRALGGVITNVVSLKADSL
jgi:hypothetical protein